MTPNFALLLSEDGIVLLNRQADGKTWANCGEVSLEDGDLQNGMRQLCDTAFRLSDGPFTTKLLLPESQLLYAEISVSENADADIRAALEDRTPYSADQLVYDASGSDGTRKVVAVARDTLEEATAFIGAFGFSPVGFTTIPPKGHFDGEPHLGNFNSATFVPDARPVLIGPAIEAKIVPPPSPQIEPTPEPEPEPEPIVEPSPQNEVAKTPPAAFSSRRRSDEADVASAGERLAKRAPRIAIPDKNAKIKAPKVEIPLRDTETAPVRVKAPTPTKPAVPVIPAAVVETPPSKPSPIARFKRSKKSDDAQPVDPIAAYAAKQNAGKPRFLGLVMTAGLLVVLGIFAAVSSFLLPEDGISGLFGAGEEEPVEVVTIEEETASDIEEFELSSLPEDVTLPDALPPLDEIVTEEEVAPEPEIIVQEDTTNVGPLNAQDAETAYAATGIWQRAPDFSSVTRSDGLDDLYVASLDPNPRFQDAPALNELPVASDIKMAAPKAPPPPGIRYDLDERGLVRPTADGALSPEGVIVFSGRPSIEPVRRDNTAVPEGLTPAILDETEIALVAPDTIVTPEATAPEQPVAATDTPFADPALANFAPRQRPADLAERVERAILGGRTRQELAGFKPNQRPQAILDFAAAAAEARAVEEAARAEAIAAAVEEATEDTGNASLVPLDGTDPEAQIASATPLAVARSVKPGSRPRGFENIVSSARPAPTPSTQPDVQTASASTASTNRGTGPAVARSSRGRSSGPTTNAVARAATDNNAISLGQVALVGVFGTSSNRRALVRLPSGRFKKVSVGDRVDGGKVAAIGASELKYTKSGRTHTLKMPKG